MYGVNNGVPHNIYIALCQSLKEPYCVLRSSGKCFRDVFPVMLCNCSCLRFPVEAGKIVGYKHVFFMRLCFILDLIPSVIDII